MSDSSTPDGNVAWLKSSRDPVPSSMTHFVEFYEEDYMLVDSVAKFLAMGLAEGGGAVVIAKPEHRQGIERRLGRSIDLGLARKRNLFVSLDAEETLALFMHDGRPDQTAFNDTLGSVMASMDCDPSELRLFGEMVTCLWDAGDATGALALEDLWNDYLSAQPARLFCGYPARILEDPSAADIHARHTHVLLPSQASS